MNQVDLIQHIETSVLPDDLRHDAITAIERRYIISGREAIKQGLVPKTVTAGSFDVATRGHAWLFNEARKIDPEGAILVVNATWKTREYKLFETAVRAALIRSYGIQMPIVLGDTPDEKNLFGLLAHLHRIPEKIIKGRRNKEDSEHTATLGPRYGVPQDHFTEVQCPEDLVDISSGEVKGLIWRLIQKDQDLSGVDPEAVEITQTVRRAVSDVVAQCAFKAIQRRAPEQNRIFEERLKHSSSEKLFAQWIASSTKS